MSMKADYVITLVGKNPIPSYYSVLNYIKNNTKVYAIYTEEQEEGVISSKTVCENIVKAIESKKENSVFNIRACYKSDFFRIKDIVEQIFMQIFEECNYENLGNRTIDLVLDYTGGTKSMATAFFSYFDKLSQNSRYEKIKIYSSYLSADKKEIYQCEFNPVSVKWAYSVEDIFEDFKITKEDLIELHGYKILNEKEDIVLVQRSDDIGVKYKFNSIKVEKCNLQFTVKTSIEKIKNLVDEYFRVSDEVEKIGGSEALVIFYVKDYNLGNDKFSQFEQARNRFYYMLKSVYSKGLEEKVSIDFEDENM